MKKSYKKIVLATITLALAFIIFFVLRSKNTIDVKNLTAKTTEKPKLAVAPLSGIACENSAARPWAVMMASDPEARPLAGIGQADMVFEMPVTESGVTRMMAVFQCTHPSEFGSIRSAREDFLPYVLGLDVIYMHWGGEHGILEKLGQHVADNIDCLKLDGTTCLRKKSIPMPHNGYSTGDLFSAKAKALGYDTNQSSVKYEHTKSKSQGIVTVPTLYSDANSVTWTYDPATNLYSRSRAGKPEIDRGTNKQVTASNIIVLQTTSTYVSILYNRVKTVGSGSATVYQNGISIPAKWQKTSDKSKLVFLDVAGKEIPFVPGTTWIEIVTQ